MRATDDYPLEHKWASYNCHEFLSICFVAFILVFCCYWIFFRTLFCCIYLLVLLGWSMLCFLYFLFWVT